MSKPLSLYDILKLQFSGLEQLDQDTLHRLEPILIQSQYSLRRELDKFATDTFSYKQRRQTLHSINRALAQIHQKNILELEYRAKQFNEFGNEMANIEVKNMQKQIGLTVPDAVSYTHLTLPTTPYV